MTEPSGANILETLLQEYRRFAAKTESISEIAGREIDRDLPVDYWTYTASDLESELWSRFPQLEAGLDIIPDPSWPASPGLVGRIKGRAKKLILRLAMPLIRRTLEKQDRFNRQSKDMLFIQFLAIKQICRQVKELEAENRELRSRLDIIEAKQSAMEPANHE